MNPHAQAKSGQSCYQGKAFNKNRIFGNLFDELIFLKAQKGVFADDLIERCVEKWFAEQEKFDLDGEDYFLYKRRGNNYTQMMWKASKKCKSIHVFVRVRQTLRITPGHYFLSIFLVGIGIGISENNIAHVCARFWPAGNNCGTFANNVPNWRWPEIERGHGDRLRLNKDMNFIKTAGKYFKQ